MAKKGKITVKHYLNKRLKPRDGKYPVYLQVSAAGKTTQVKSLAIGKFKYINDEFEFPDEEEEKNYLTENEFESSTGDSKSEIYKILEIERKGIKRFLEFIAPYNLSNFNLSKFNRAYELLTTDIQLSLRTYLVEAMRDRLKRISSPDYKILLQFIDPFLDDNSPYVDLLNFIKEHSGKPIQQVEDILDEIHFINQMINMINHFSDTRLMLEYELFVREDKLLSAFRKNEFDRDPNNRYFLALSSYIDYRKWYYKNLF